MITRRSFISKMKKNGYTYSPKTRLLYRGEFDGNPGLEVYMYIRVATAYDSKEYVTMWIQDKYRPYHLEQFHVADYAATKATYDYVPYEHVMLLLSLIKDIRKWWLT